MPVQPRGTLPRFCKPCLHSKKRAYVDGYERPLPTEQQMHQAMALRAAELRLKHEATKALLLKGLKLGMWSYVRDALAELNDIVDIRDHIADSGYDPGP